MHHEKQCTSALEHLSKLAVQGRQHKKATEQATYLSTRALTACWQFGGRSILVTRGGWLEAQVLKTLSRVGRAEMAAPPEEVPDFDTELQDYLRGLDLLNKVDCVSSHENTAPSNLRA